MLADSLSMALLVLETLLPLERAAFVLREVFDRPYPGGRSRPWTAASSRSASSSTAPKDHVDAGHARYQADLQTHTQVVDRFVKACENADVEALMEILAPDVVMISDGGGLPRRAPRRPTHDRDKVARLLATFALRGHRKAPPTPLEHFNGAPGLVARVDGVAIRGDGRCPWPRAASSPSSSSPNPQKLVFMETQPELR